MQFINLHTHQFTHQAEVLEIVNQYPNDFDSDIPYFSVGIHPMFIETDRLEDDFQVLKDKIQLSGCMAIGECGIDKRSAADLEMQMKVLEKQLEIAEQIQKPVILHCVNGYQELIALKMKVKTTVPLIIHGFSKKDILAQQLLHHGFYLSFGKQILQNTNLALVLKNTPNERFLLETDVADIKIQEVYTAAAAYKALAVEEIQTIVNQNFNALFLKNKKFFN